MAYELKPTDGSSIDPAKAKALMENYSMKFPDSIKAYFFGHDLIDQIINEQEAVGMRIYLGYNNDEGKIQMLLVGSRADGSDIWPTDTNKINSAVIGDTGVPCPPYCSR